MFFDFDNLYFTFAVWLHIFLKKWSRERGSYIIFEINFTTRPTVDRIKPCPELHICARIPRMIQHRSQ